MSDLEDRSGDVGECPSDARARFRLPPVDLRSNSVVSMLDEGADRLGMREREDELHLLPAPVTRPRPEKDVEGVG